MIGRRAKRDEAIPHTEIPSVAQPVLSEREGLPRNDVSRHCEEVRGRPFTAFRTGSAISCVEIPSVAQPVLSVCEGLPRNDERCGNDVRRGDDVSARDDDYACNDAGTRNDG